MATLIPAIGSCAARMTSGERRLAERLEQQLDDDYLVWYDVPIGPKQSRPDFVVLHPRRGILILETKDWRLETIREATRQAWTIVADGRLKTLMSPLAQARHCAIQVVNALERDPQLVHPDGPHQGKLAFPWGHGVVFTRITRKQFDGAGLDQAIEPHVVICAEEMQEAGDAEAFQRRLWNMFPHAFGRLMTLPQLDRVRWILFPEVRVSTQQSLFVDGASDDGDAATGDVPSVMRVMDLQQEQLARSLGDGHRVIHGVAGSGKTMILGYRAEHLAAAGGAASKPVLVLCYNEPLAVSLAARFEARGLADRVHARHFHKWCREQLVAFGQPVPSGSGDALFATMVDNVIRGAERRQIPVGQYRAVLIDEGHDFEPAWLKLVTQMVDPLTNSVLLLYDDAQSIWQRRQNRRQFSFRSVGIQAQGRTTILKINYRNTRQILQVAHRVAAELLMPKDRGVEAGDEDGVPLLQPISCGRDGEAPIVVRLPSLRDEAVAIADALHAAHQEGHAWADMAVLCRDFETIDACATALAARRLPHRSRKRTGDFKPGDDCIKLMTMKVSKGLEFAVVALAGVGRMPAANEDAIDEARIFYVAATRATSRLLITVSGDGDFGRRLGV